VADPTHAVAERLGNMYVGFDRALNHPPTHTLAGITLTVEPARVQATRTGRFTVTTHNDTATSVDLDLQVLPDVGVTTTVTPAHLQVPAGAAARAELTVTSRAPLTLRPRSHSLTVHGDDSTGRQWLVGASFQQRLHPLLAVGSLLAAVVLLVLAATVLFFKPDNASGTQAFDTAIGNDIAPDRPAKGAGSIESPGVQDRYTLTGRQGQQVYLDAQECGGGELDWSLTAPDGEPVFKDESLCGITGPHDRGVLSLPQTGRYQLTVRGSGDDAGTYRVRLQNR